MPRSAVPELIDVRGELPLALVPLGTVVDHLQFAVRSAAAIASSGKQLSLPPVAQPPEPGAVKTHELHVRLLQWLPSMHRTFHHTMIALYDHLEEQFGLGAIPVRF